MGDAYDVSHLLLAFLGGVGLTAIFVGLFWDIGGRSKDRYIDRLFADYDYYLDELGRRERNVM
jgi:hypothetical protein